MPIAPNRQQRDMQMQLRAASFAPDTINEESRSVELVWTTGAPVRRYDWWRERAYEEVLVVSAEAIRMDRLQNGAALLDTHQRWGLNSQLGVVEKAWIEKGVGRAIVRFSQRPEADAVWRDVKDGIVRNVSVGYMIHRIEVERAKDDKSIDIYRVVDWEPTEISFVPVPADAGAQSRSDPARAAQPEHGQRHSVCDFILSSAAADETPAAPAATLTTERTMPNTTETGGATTDATTIPAAAAPAPAPATAANENRAAPYREIRAATKAAKLDDDFAGDLAERGLTMDQVRAEIIAKLAESDGPPAAGSLSVGREDVEKQRDAVSNVLLARSLPASVTLEQGNPYAYRSMLEIGRELLTRAGHRTGGLAPFQLAERILTTSDFPYILANVGNKTLRSSYETQPRTFLTLGRRETIRDFKPVQRTQLGDAPDLKLINEAGVITHGAIGEGKEGYQLASYGRMLSFTRQALINDDLSAFTRMATMFGSAAARLENDLVWGMITANAAMNDNVALFHATHKNVDNSAAASTIVEATLNSASMLLAKQTTLDGNELNLQGRTIVAPVALGMAARKAVAAVTPNQTSEVNTFAGSYGVVTEPRLDTANAKMWYLFGDFNIYDTFEYAYLEGTNGPVVESQPQFSSLGVDIRCFHDFAAKAIDWRNMVQMGGS